MDLVDEEHIARREIGEYRREVADAFDGGAGGCAHARAYLFGHQMRERGLAQSWRTIEEDVLRLVVAAFGSRKEDAKIFFNRRLPDVLFPQAGAQRLVERAGAFFYFTVRCGHIFWSTPALRGEETRSRLRA